MSDSTPTSQHDSNQAQHVSTDDFANDRSGAAGDDVQPGADSAQRTGSSDSQGTIEPGDAPQPEPLASAAQIKRSALITTALGVLTMTALCSKNARHAWGVPAGLVATLMTAWGICDLVKSFDAHVDVPASSKEDAERNNANRNKAEIDDVGRSSSISLREFAPSILVCVAAATAFMGALAAAQAAIGPWWLASITVPATFVATVGAVFRAGTHLGPWRVDETGSERPLLRRHGFWVMVIGACLYFPAMGLKSLWDPWETHYGEVAREIVSRDDWISLWWAHEGWFWSKPILNFWIQAIAMASLGTHVEADTMLHDAHGGWTARPEWVVRTPNVLMTIVALYLLYKGVSKVFGRRAGLLSALVLATMSDWFFLAHQTMTDMPFVAAMTGAMALLLAGLNTPEDERARSYAITAWGRSWHLSVWHLVFGAVLVTVLPQIVYLATRNLEWVSSGPGPHGLRSHWDEFMSGSPGNCGLAGHEACTMRLPAAASKFASASSANAWVLGLRRLVVGFEPVVQALVWAVGLGAIIWPNRNERRTRRLLFIAAWWCAAIATMAKGPAGFGLPILCAFAYVATQRRWKDIPQLEVVTGLLVIATVALPWFVAMYMRHGSGFTDRLIFHDMFNRAFSHVHDTNEGDDTGLRFYLWQLGYALFPWTGLAPLGLLWTFRQSDAATASSRSDEAPGAGSSNGATWFRSGQAVGDASVFMVMWFVFAFVLFTMMGTKFHHYIFPAVPPMAVLVGVVVDDALGNETLCKPHIVSKLMYFATLALGALMLLWGVTFVWPGTASDLANSASHEPQKQRLGMLLIATGLVTTLAGALVFSSRAAQQTSDRAPSPESSEATMHHRRMIAGSAVVGAAATALVGRDFVAGPIGANLPGAIRLIHLFTYNYRRAWPETLDFTSILAAFTAVIALVLIAASAARLRKHAILAMCSIALLWAAWGLDVYMVKLSPHWGQREITQAYYERRSSAEEPLVAYQMNWKGENFYTSNHVPTFVSTGTAFDQWLKKQRDTKGVHVMFFVTEHSRIAGLRREVNAKRYEEITSRALCNKFILIRAEL